MKRIILIILLSAFISGCFQTGGANLSDNQEALTLVDNGVLLLRDGQLDRARASFDMAYNLSGSAAALDGLGCVAFLLGEYKAAEEYFWRAYEVDSSYNNSLGNLALLYEKIGDHKRAEEIYLRAVSEDPKNFRSRNNYAAFMADNKRLSKDQAASEKVLIELLKAEALAQHPLIQDNIRRISSER